MTDAAAEVSSAPAFTSTNTTTLNSHFPRQLGKPVPYLDSGFIGARANRGGGDYKTCEGLVQSSSPTNQHPAFYRLDAFPVTQPTVSEHSLSLRFNGHFPGGPGLAGTKKYPFWILLELRVMEVVVTTGAIRRANLQSNVTTN